MSITPDEGPSLGELGRQVQTVLVKIEGLIKDIELKYVSKELYNAHKTASDQKIAGLEDNTKWLVRTVIGLVITLTIAAVFVTSGGKA